MYRILIVAAFVLAAGAGGFFLAKQQFSPAIAPAVTAPADPPRFNIVVRGRLEPVDGIIHVGAFSEVGAATLEKLLVRNGEQVQPGQPVAVLGNAAMLDLEAESIGREVELARKKLEQTRRPYREGAVAALQAAVDSRRIDLNLAEDQLKRSQTLKDDVRSEAEKVRTIGALAKARAELAQAEASIRALTDISLVEIAVMEAEVALAEARHKASRERASKAIIRAPAAGQVIHIGLRPGESLARGEILQLADMKNVKIVAEVDERLIELIALGSKAQVKVRGGERAITATVIRIGKVVNSTDRLPLDAATGRAGRFVEVDLVSDDAELLPLVARLELSVSFTTPAQAR